MPNANLASADPDIRNTSARHYVDIVITAIPAVIGRIVGNAGSFGGSGDKAIFGGVLENVLTLLLVTRSACNDSNAEVFFRSFEGTCRSLRPWRFESDTELFSEEPATACRMPQHSTFEKSVFPPMIS